MADDPPPFHLDETAAKSTLSGGLAASVFHTAALTEPAGAAAGELRENAQNVLRALVKSNIGEMAYGELQLNYRL